MERTNKIYVIGTLSQVKDTRSGEKDGIAWVAGTAVVTSGTNEIEFKYYSSEKTKAGKPNSRYTNYTGLEARVGERVKVNGELSGRLWFNEGQGQVINFNELSAGSLTLQNQLKQMLLLLNSVVSLLNLYTNA